MEATEILGRITFFSLMGVMFSVGLSIFLEYQERLWYKPLPKAVWKRFVQGCWVLILSFGISFIGWLVFSIFDWITAHV